ncbi:MAG: hypothetical protein WDW36_003839 [Sanguina aurantia]
MNLHPVCSRASARDPESVKDSPVQHSSSPPATKQSSSHTISTLNADIAEIAIPTLIALAADPIAGLVDTIYVGRLGSMQLAGVGIALSVFNTATRLLNTPLLSVANSAVAAAVGREQQRKQAQQGLGDAMQTHATASRARDAAGDGDTRSKVSESAVDSSGNSSSSLSSSLSSILNSSSITSSTSDSSRGGSDNGSLGASHSSTSSESKGRVPTAADASEPAVDEVSLVASSVLGVACIAGIVQATVLSLACGWAVTAWGAPDTSALHHHALDFLRIRALGSPITVLMFALQGIFRGLSDTRTPLAATLTSNIINCVLGLLFIFGLGMGVGGAALATVLAQALPCAYLLQQLNARHRVVLSAASMKQTLQLFGPTGYLIMRTTALAGTMALATSLAARAGPYHAACHQICFQVWLASSLLADSVAVAAQSLLGKVAGRHTHRPAPTTSGPPPQPTQPAGSSQADEAYAAEVVRRTCVFAGGLGLLLALALTLSGDSLPLLFTQDKQVVALMAGILPVVILTQPLNALAFVWDGVLFGYGGFKYAAVATAASALPAVAVMLASAKYSSSAEAQLLGVWLGLATVMTLRIVTIGSAYMLRIGPFRPWSMAESKH